MPRAVTSPTGQMLTSEAKPTDAEIEESAKLCQNKNEIINDKKDGMKTDDEVKVKGAEEAELNESSNVGEEAPAGGEDEKKENGEGISEVKESATSSGEAVDNEEEDGIADVEENASGEGEVPNENETADVEENAPVGGEEEVQEKEKDLTTADDLKKDIEEELHNVTEQAFSDQEIGDQGSEKEKEEIATAGEVGKHAEEENAPADGDVVEESEGSGEAYDDDKKYEYSTWEGEKTDGAVNEWPTQYGDTEGQEEAAVDDGKDYEEWNGAEETTADEDESEILMLDDVKETLAKITDQLEADQDNSDLKVLAEFTEEYEKMSETQISLQQKLTTVLAETNALWQEFEKYRPEYAKVMWEEKKEERQQGQTGQTWDQWDGKDKSDWKGNWRAAETNDGNSGDGGASWTATKTWSYRDADDNDEQQEGGWKSNDGKKWDTKDANDKNESDQSGWKSNGGKDWSGGEGASKESNKDWDNWGKDKATTKSVSWRDAEGGNGESAEWKPQSGGRRGYDKKWDGKEQEKWENDKGDWKDKNWKDEGDKGEKDEVNGDNEEEGKASYNELEDEVIRLRKAVAENEKALASAASAPPPPPAPPVVEPAAPASAPAPAVQPVQLPPPPPPQQPQQVTLPQAYILGQGPHIPYVAQDGRTMEEMTEKITRDIEDRLKSKYKAEMAELEMRHYKEMQNQMRYIMQQQQQRSPSPPREYARPSRVAYHGGYEYHPEQYSSAPRSRPHGDDRYGGERMVSPLYRDGSISGMSGYAPRSPTGYMDARESPAMAPPSAPPRDRRERKLSPSHAKPRRPHQPPNVDRTTSRAVQEPRAPRPTYYGQTAPPPVAPVTLPEPPRATRSSPAAPLVEETLSVDNAMKAYRHDGPSRGGAASSSYRPSELNNRDFDGNN